MADFKLSTPAIIAAIAYAIMCFIILLPLQPKHQDLQVNTTFAFRLLIVIILLIPLALSVYSINCMMVGNCVIWSYIQAIMIALWVLLFIVATLMAYTAAGTIAQKIEEKKIEQDPTV
jgi:hypothetical protein